MIDEFLLKAEREKVSLETVREPSTQFAIFEAQKGYAKSGYSEHLDLLTTLLSTKCHSKLQADNFTQTCMNGAIEATGKLTPKMINSLSLSCSVRYRLAASDGHKTTLEKYFQTHIIPTYEKASFNNAELSFIELTGCLSIARGMISKKTIESAFDELYPDVFAKVISSVGVESMSQIISSWMPDFQRLEKLWGESYQAHSFPTPVGACIGLLNLRRITGRFYDPARWVRSV